MIALFFYFTTKTLDKLKPNGLKCYNKAVSIRRKITKDVKHAKN